MRRTIRRLFEPPNPLDRFGRLHVDADAAIARRDWDAARAGYAAALGIDPLRDDLWVQYGHALKEMGRTAAAGDAYATAARLAPQSRDAQWHAALAFRAEGRLADAGAACHAVLDVDPTCAEARAILHELGDTRPRQRHVPSPFQDVRDLPVRRDVAPPAGPAPSAWPDLRTLPPRLVPGGRRPPIVFFHLHKTGGLTLDDLIGHHVAPARICPVKDDRLHVFDRAALDSFDLFSGHCDVGALRLIGRPVRTVSMFREPRARLISFYRFHRGHDLGGRHGVNAFAQLANALGPEAFFEDARVRAAPEVFNHYLTVFSLTYQQLRTAQPVTVDRVTPAVVDAAVARVIGLDVIGIMERFDASAALCCDRLGLPRPRAVRPINGTDAVAIQMKRERVPEVLMTPRLRAALADLVRFDDPIYAAAVAEFERRLAAGPKAAVPVAAAR